MEAAKNDLATFFLQSWKFLEGFFLQKEDEKTDIIVDTCTI